MSSIPPIPFPQSKVTYRRNSSPDGTYRHVYVCFGDRGPMVLTHRQGEATIEVTPPGDQPLSLGGKGPSLETFEALWAKALPFSGDTP